MPLPYTPPPNSDEVLSSWIERIGLFYGIGYLRTRMMLNLSRSAIAWGENEDVDSSDEVRRSLILLTGYDERVVPPLLDTTVSRILGVSARLAYCAACWHEDVEHGCAPYIRSHWSSRSIVMCVKHETWLSARRPGIQFGSELNGWAPIWSTEPNWARAANLGHDLAMRPFTLGFEPKGIVPPNCAWTRVNAEFQVMASDKFVFQLVSCPESASVRAHVLDAIEVARNPRVTDLDLRGYRSSEPGWIVDRICCLSVATEVRRMVLGIEPAFERVRAVLQEHPAASALLLKCHGHMRRDHDSCQIPAHGVATDDG
jgi:hypothetical protein